MTRFRSLLGLSLVLASTGCAGLTESARATESYRVYDAVVAAMSSGVIQLHQDRPTAGPLAIVDRTDSDDVGDDEQIKAMIGKSLKEAPRGVVDDYLRVRDVPQNLERRFQIGLSHELVPFDTRHRIEVERYPAGVVTFSPVGFARSGREALLYVSHYCGPLCATGHLVFLRSDERGWKVERTVAVMAS